MGNNTVLPPPSPRPFDGYRLETVSMMNGESLVHVLHESFFNTVITCKNTPKAP